LYVRRAPRAAFLNSWRQRGFADVFANFGGDRRAPIEAIRIKRRGESEAGIARPVRAAREEKRWAIVDARLCEV
jgi:hypothetical protein